MGGGAVTLWVRVPFDEVKAWRQGVAVLTGEGDMQSASAVSTKVCSRRTVMPDLLASSKGNGLDSHSVGIWCVSHRRDVGWGSSIGYSRCVDLGWLSENRRARPDEAFLTPRFWIAILGHFQPFSCARSSVLFCSRPLELGRFGSAL